MVPIDLANERDSESTNHRAHIEQLEPELDELREETSNSSMNLLQSMLKNQLRVRTLCPPCDAPNTATLSHDVATFQQCSGVPAWDRWAYGSSPTNGYSLASGLPISPVLAGRSLPANNGHNHQRGIVSRGGDLMHNSATPDYRNSQDSDVAGVSIYQMNSMPIPSALPSGTFHPDTSPSETSPTSELQCPSLQRNGTSQTLRKFIELLNPPDLFASLREEQIRPPQGDKYPSSPGMVPYEQELKFEGDLYTPRWVRGHGCKREGWCGVCKPGKWLRLRNSSYWYHKTFKHGICKTGNPFQGPLDMRRMDGYTTVWEGLCECNEWIAISATKTTPGTKWFRHLYKVRDMR